MKEFDKKFADTYIDEQIRQEKEMEKTTFYENMNGRDKIIYQMLYKTKYEEPPIIKFFLKCNWFEKIMLIVAQVGACVLPFTILASFGTAQGAAKMVTISIVLWLTCSACLLLMAFSRRVRTGEKISISFIPKFNNK